MTRRRLPFLAALAVALAGTVAALVFLVRDERPPSIGLPLGDDGVAARASVGSRTLLFGEVLPLRLELLVDREVLDADRITVDAEFDPFTPAAEPVRERTDHDRFTRIRLDYALECLTTICVPDTLTKDFDLPSVAVRHDGVPVEIVEWPRLTIASRYREPEADRSNPTFQPRFDLPWRANLRVRPPSYAVGPTLLTSLLVVAALALLLASLFFVQRAFPSAPIGFRRLRRVRLSPLERALLVLERAHAQGIEREQRLALDRLAHELRSGGQPELAGRARELAWEQAAPDSERTATLSERVRELIAGRTNGRP